jgi:hypothetical protein
LLPPAKAFGRKNLPKNQQDNQLMRILPPSSVIVKLYMHRWHAKFEYFSGLASLDALDGYFGGAPTRLFPQAC